MFFSVFISDEFLFFILQLPFVRFYNQFNYSQFNYIIIPIIIINYNY